MNWKVKFNGTFFITLTFITVGLFFVAFLIHLQDIHPDISDAADGHFIVPSSVYEGNTTLDGEWLFAGSRLVAPADSTAPFEMVTLPHVLESSEYGTYKLTLEGLVPKTSYSFYIFDVPSAYNLYLDNELIYSNGTVGMDQETESLQLGSKVITFIPKTSSVQMLLQVSNHHSYAGGLIQPFTFGETESVLKLHRQNMNMEMFLIGAILIMAIYNLCLFALNPKELPALFFFILNLMVSGRILLTGERLINEWFATPNWEILFMLMTIFGAWMLGTFALFLYTMFDEHMHRKFILFVVGMCLIFSFAFPVLPPSLIAAVDFIYIGLTVSFFIYSIVTLVRCMKTQVLGSTFSFIGIVFVLGGTLLDIVLPAHSNIIPMTILIFIVFQSLAIAEKYSSIAEQNKLLNYVATRDGMTNLYKKKHFVKLIHGIIDSDAPVIQHALMFIDIDDFKHVNDTYGHDIGDKVIITFAERLVHALRYSDIACRYGGDEFVVWLHNTRNEDCEFIAHRILEQIQEPIVIDARAIHISSSIGIAFYPTDGATLEELIVTSDRRMYIAKRRGKNTYVYHN